MKLKKALTALVCLVLVLSMMSVMALAATDGSIPPKPEDGQATPVNPDPSVEPAPNQPVVVTGNDDGESWSDRNERTIANTIYDLEGPKEVDPSEDAIFTCPTSFDDFLGVEVDGEPLDKENYSAERGSTVVTFSAKYLSTLSKGEHSVKLLFKEGSARMTFTIKAKAFEDNPATGLELSGNVLAAALALTTVCGGALAVSTKKKG